MQRTARDPLHRTSVPYPRAIWQPEIGRAANADRRARRPLSWWCRRDRSLRHLRDGPVKAGSIATEQKPIELILARSLLDSLATPGCLIDFDGTLVYYNDAVARLAGMSFEETGPMSAAEWSEAFGPFDAEGQRIPFEEHPLTLAVRGGRAGHYLQRFRTTDGKDLEVAVSAIPLVGTTGFNGALVFFWPARDE